MHCRNQPTSETSSQIFNKSIDTKKRIEKFKLCRYFETKLNTLKRDLREQNKIHDQSLSKMFSYILGDDPRDQNSSYDMNSSKRSFWLLKENKENISEDGDGNLLDLLSSSVNGDSLMSYYKKGQKGSNILNNSQNTVNRANDMSSSSSVVGFLKQRKAKIQKEKAIKMILRKLLEIYFENMLTFFKIVCDPDFRYIRSPEIKIHSFRSTLEDLNSNRGIKFEQITFEQIHDKNHETFVHDEKPEIFEKIDYFENNEKQDEEEIHEDKEGDKPETLEKMEFIENYEFQEYKGQEEINEQEEEERKSETLEKNESIKDNEFYEYKNQEIINEEKEEEKEKEEEIEEPIKVNIVHSRQLSEISNTNLHNRPLASSIYLNEGAAANLLEEDAKSPANRGFLRESPKHASPNKADYMFSPKLIRKVHSRQLSQASMDKENIQEEIAASNKKIPKKKKKPLGFYSGKKVSIRNQYDKENLSSTQQVFTPQREPLALFQTNTSDFIQEYRTQSSNLDKINKNELNIESVDLMGSIEREYITKKKPSNFLIENQAKKAPKQRKEKLFEDTEILWILHSELNDILPSDLIKVPRKVKARQSIPHEKRFNATLEESALDEILKNAKVWNQENQLNKSRKTYLKSPQNDKIRHSAANSFNVTLTQNQWGTEKLFNKSMNESMLVSKLKELQEDLLFSPASSRRETEENPLQEKILMLTQRIKSVRISPRNRRERDRSPSEKPMTSLEASLMKQINMQRNEFQDIPKKFVSSMEVDLKDDEKFSARELEANENEGDNEKEIESARKEVPVQRRRQAKFVPFVKKLRIMTALIAFMSEKSGLKEAFEMIKEFSDEIKAIEIEEEQRERQKQQEMEQYLHQSLEIKLPVEEFKRPSREDPQNIIFASFSHTFPDTKQILSEERFNDDNEINSPQFNTKRTLVASGFAERFNQKDQITPSQVQGVLIFERILSRQFRRDYRMFFDNLQDIIIEQEENIQDRYENLHDQYENIQDTYETQEQNEPEVERHFEYPVMSLEEQMENSMVRLASVEENNYFGQRSTEEYEREEDVFLPKKEIQREHEIPRRIEAIKFEGETQEDDDDDVRSYSNISSLTDEDQMKKTERTEYENNENFDTQGNNMQLGIMNTDAEFKKLLDYVLKNPQIQDQLKASINFSVAAPVQEEEKEEIDNQKMHQEWKQTLEQTLESTLEKKLEMKLQQLLEEKLANREIGNEKVIYKESRELQTMDFYPEIHLTKTATPSRIHSSRKDYTGPCFTSLTTPRPAQSTYVTGDMKASHCEWQENEMDGSMQKFQPLNENSIRQEEEERQYDGWRSKRNTLDDVLYIYESVQKEGEGGMQRDFEENILEARHKHTDQTLRHRYPDDQTLSDGDNEILRELEFPTQNSQKKSIYLNTRRIHSILSRDVHFFYILDHIIFNKNKELLASAFSKMRGCQPYYSMCLSSGSQSGFYQNDLVYSRSNVDFSRDYEQKSRFLSLSQARLTKSISKQNWLKNSDACLSSVSITIPKSQYFTGVLQLFSCLERKQLKICFEAMKDSDNFDNNDFSSTRAMTEQRQVIMQNIFWLLNVLQRNQWKNLKWGFSNLLEASKTRDNTLKCLVLIGKIEDLLKKRQRQSFTKIYYDQTKKEKMITTRRNTSIHKISTILKNNMKRSGFDTLFNHAYRMALISHRFDRLSYMIENRNMALLWHCFRKVRRFAHIKKEQTLYVVKLSEVLKEIQKSKMKSYFFLMKKKSHSMFMRKLEKRSAFKKVLDKKMFRDYLEVKNFFWKWKSMCLFQTTKRFSRSFRDIQPTKEKAYLANFLNKLFTRKLVEEKHRALLTIKEHSRKVKGIERLNQAITELLIDRVNIVGDVFKKHEEEIQNKKEKSKQINMLCNLIQDKRRRNLKKAFSRLSKTNIPQKRLEMNDKLMKLEGLMTNLKRNNLQKGMKMIELNFISRKNFESLCINLVLKTVILMKNKQHVLQKAFFDNLTEGYLQEVQLKKFLKGVVARKHIKSLSYFFNKFRTRLTVLKASKSALNLLTKNYSMGIEKLMRIRKNQLANAFNKLHAFRKAPRREAIQSNKFGSGNKAARMRSPQPVITLDITSDHSVVNHPPKQTKKESNHQKVMEFAFRMDKVVSKIMRKLQRSVFDRLYEGPEIVGNQRYYVAMNNIDKLLFKKKLRYFLQFKEATKEEEEETTPVSRMSWNSNFDSEYFKQKEEKIERLRTKKYFNEWRLTYIKYVNRRNRLNLAFNKLFNFHKKSTIQAGKNVFAHLRELFSSKQQHKLQLTLVSNSSHYSKPKQHESSRMSINSQSRDRGTPSPLPFNGSQPKSGIPKSSYSPAPNNRRETYSIGIVNNDMKDKRNSVSPAPSVRTGRRFSDRSPQMKENSFMVGAGQRSRQGSNSKSPLQNKKENRFLHEVPMYSIAKK